MTESALDGLTVSGFLAIASTLLGGGSSSVSLATAAGVAEELTYIGIETISQYAQDHLFTTSCP